MKGDKLLGIRGRKAYLLYIKKKENLRSLSDVEERRGRERDQGVVPREGRQRKEISKVMQRVLLWFGNRKKLTTSSINEHKRREPPEPN